MMYNRISLYEMDNVFFSSLFSDFGKDMVLI